VMEAGSKPLTFAPRRSLLARLGLSELDGVMLAAAGGLVAFGVFALATVGRHELPDQPLYFAARQGLYGAGGIAAMLLLARFDYTRLRDIRVMVYAAMIAAIALVLVGGAAVRGSQRWIELPLLRFQPSEFAKLLLVVSLGALAFERVRRPNGLRQTLVLLALGLAPAALVLLQPDLGTAVVLAAVAVTVLYVAGIPWQHFAAIGLAGLALTSGALALGSAVGLDPLRGYQEDRLTAFLHPSDDPADASYQVNQALIAAGSGEVTGRGGAATQSELLFLPERHTDFAFAAIGERFGFMGAGFVIFLYAVLFWRAVRVMRSARSHYGMIVAGGILAMLGFQAIVNMGMNLGLTPVTGIPLPLVSYGGSSVLATLLALGVLQSIHAQSRT
jgi:rod shape determining protein RodA